MAKNYPHIVIPPPGPRAKAIIDRDRTFASTAYIKEYPLVIERGEGPMVQDVDGNRFLDFMAGIAVSATGYNRPEVVKAVQDAAAKFLHICGGDFYYETMAALCERLAGIAPGPGKKRVFLSNSGTEAIEGAMKLARYATGRTAFVAFKGAFHGRTYGALSMTSSKSRQHGGFGPFLPDVHHVFYGYCYRCEFGKTFPECGIYCVDHIERDLFARHLDPQDVAAVFVEPIQGEGGYIVPPPGWLGKLRELCTKHGILLVMDEVQSGIGRTGKMFACEHEGVVPDILVTAKGLGSGMPIGAFIAREEISTWKPGSHGSTFGGNPVCCAAALATLDLVERELMPNARVQGERLMKGLKTLADKHGVIGDVRGRGLMQGIELVMDRATREPAGDLARKLMDLAFKKGLLTLAAGRNALRFAPPLVVDQEDVDIALNILEQSLSEMD